ncbi:hypothetical protein B4100_3843 [Heyndrickxia coagulans]|nr:hypothetical protein B4100_3843 [Heyndrickxia coagulans]
MRLAASSATQARRFTAAVTAYTFATLTVLTNGLTNISEK